MERAKIHVLNELPHIHETEDMMAFCRKYKHIYIYGIAENQEYLLKYLDICGIHVDGFTVSVGENTNQCLFYRQIPIVCIDEVTAQKDTGIILGLSDRHYHYIIPKFRKAGFDDYFVMTEFNKRSIANQMKPRPIEEMTFEVNLADHCNISCQMCDHYSQLSEECFVDMDTFERDMKRMGKLFNHKIACITLLGGEPTLHKDIIKCMEITRREFPNGQIIILTNGILLFKLEHAPEGNIWQACKDYHVDITVTVYPINLDYEALEKKAAEYGIVLGMSSNIHAKKLTKIVKISDKHTFDLGKSVDKNYFVSCLYFNKFNVLKNGRYYMCPVAAHIGIFNKHFDQKLELADGDSLDIYKVEDWKEFSEFASSMVPFCQYCDHKRWGKHSEWKASTKQIEEYI